MRDWICGFFMAWGMFLAIPCPRKIWSESARQKMLVCMPLVGLLAGGVWAGAWLLLRGAPGPVRAAVCAAAPWLVTGFMHLDGYMDVCDAVLSRRDLATRQRILLHATPSLLFTLAYAGACLIWKDHPVYAYSEWKSLVTNPPSLIRTLYLLAYIIQSGIYAKLFLHERHTYLSLLGGVKTEDRWLKLGQVTSAFFLASGIGLCTLSLALNPYLPHEITVTFLFTVFYFAFGIFYANFSSTYRDVRTRIREQNSAFSPPAGADMEELICYLQPDDDNNRLFKDIEAYFQKEQPYLDPDFRISDLPRTIGANPHKLSTAVGRATGLTVQDYVLRLRIGHSADLLLLPENAERTIEDIAFSSGFQSTSTYNRNFLKLMKTTPSRFRSRT